MKYLFINSSNQNNIQAIDLGTKKKKKELSSQQ